MYYYLYFFFCNNNRKTPIKSLVSQGIRHAKFLAGATMASGLASTVEHINQVDPNSMPFTKGTELSIIIAEVANHPDQYPNVWRMLVQASFGVSICALCRAVIPANDPHHHFWACSLCEKQIVETPTLTSPVKAFHCPGFWSEALLLISKVDGHMAFCISEASQSLVRKIVSKSSTITETQGEALGEVRNFPFRNLRMIAPGHESLWNSLYKQLVVKRIADTPDVPFALLVFSQVSFIGLGLQQLLQQLDHLLETQNNCVRVASLCYFLGLVDDSNPPYFASLSLQNSTAIFADTAIGFYVGQPCGDGLQSYANVQDMFIGMDTAAAEELIQNSLKHLTHDQKTGYSDQDAVYALRLFSSTVMQSCQDEWDLFLKANTGMLPVSTL